jgi:hypothetical protein
MNPATEAMIERMLETSRNGHDIIPMMFQPVRGRSNTVSAAIRVALSRGLIEQAGVDGLGKPKYRAVMPRATHPTTTSFN